MSRFCVLGIASCVFVLSACSSGNMKQQGSTVGVPVDPNTAEKVPVDRFSDAAAHLQKRSAASTLPGPNEAVNFDQGPFITEGFGPDGSVIEYYNFDVQPTAPAPIYVPMKSGKTVDAQLNIVGVVPGDADYNDFWQVVAVAVPDDYQANSLTSVAEVMTSGFSMTTTSMLVNCPIVPEGSTASKRYPGDMSGSDLQRGWYDGKVVYYFSFGEKQGGLSAADGKVPLSPIYVTFNDDATGPSSGFKTEADGIQTHNVTATLPTDSGYSPLWAVTPYPDADFASVHDLSSAETAAGSASVAADVNCPIVSLTSK